MSEQASDWKIEQASKWLTEWVRENGMIFDGKCPDLDSRNGNI